ncbi:MAG: right-handed parallel beta-helix repeat-containing protein [Ruminococcaceae bacterium]|nr:right-handed parallel beta-helix repeat-containing protein [Oscillospiraceae bacterium]
MNKTENITISGTGKLFLYLDPEMGRDENNGEISSPLKSLKTAISRLREIRKASEHIIEAVVCMREGVHSLCDTLILNSLDSHTSFVAFEGETPVISGGVKIDGWTEGENGIWHASAKGVKSRDFFVNGKRATRARHSGFDIVSFDEKGIEVRDEIMANVKKPRELEFVFRYMWNMSRLCAENMSSDGDGKTIFTMREPGWGTYFSTAELGMARLIPEEVFYAENAYEFLNDEGEWYLDRDGDTVYYIPRKGEDMSCAEAYLGKLEQMIFLKGEEGSFIEDLRFESITFSHNTWFQAEKDEGLLTIQANHYKKYGSCPENSRNYENWMMPLSAIEGRFVKGTVFENCRFINLGSGALHLMEGTKDSDMCNNYFWDCAGTAISLGAFSDRAHDATETDDPDIMCERVRIEDNLIENVACVYAGGEGISVGYTKDSSVSYNTLRDLPYTAISLGWGWGGRDSRDMNKCSTFCRNRICNNYIENVMNVLFDGGGIYTLGRNDDSLISGNYIKNVNNDYGAIYLDDGSVGFTVKDNVIIDCHRNYIYKGDYNYISGNYANRPGIAPDFDLRTPFEEGAPRYLFENNDLWDKDKVEEIKSNAGQRK